MTTLRKFFTYPFFTIGLICIIGAVLFYLNYARFNAWIVDDAGISFAYSRNLAEGQGLVAQVGAKPVEGFSNPTWVFLYSLIPLFGLDILAVTKLISLMFSLGVIFLSAAIGYLITRSVLATLIGVGWIVLQPGLIIWFSSGLENPLYVFLILLLAWLTLGTQNRGVPILAGGIAALIGLTRPEGCLFLFGYLLLQPKSWKPYLLSFLAVYGTYVGFRLIYFGYPLPNTFYMKIGSRFDLVQWLKQLYFNFRVLGNGLFGKIGFFVGVLLIPALYIRAFITKNFSREIQLLTVFSAIAFITYVFLPPDWMGELRFASSILVLAPLLLIALLPAGANKREGQWSLSVMSIGCAILFGWAITNYFTDFRPRLDVFSQAPTVDLRSVQASAHVYTELADILNLEEYSVLQADVGGALWLNQYRVIDLGGLVDGTIARTLDRDHQALYQYLFTEVNPELIEIHGKWALRADLSSSQEFNDRYQAIAPADGGSTLNGVFVRKDLITSEDQIERMQALLSR